MAQSSLSLHRFEWFDPKPGHAAEVGLIVGANEDTEAEMDSGRGYGKVVCGDEATLAMQDRKQISPALGSHHEARAVAISCQYEIASLRSQ